jgi:hypothetical protein
VGTGVSEKDHAQTHDPGKVGTGFPIRIMRKKKAKKSRPWWGRGRGSRNREEEEEVETKTVSKR